MISPFGIKIGSGGSTPTPAPVGATLMKTGQTTSYRTGDDGDLEVGRATSFTVLASNNPFGNTNRFTDELGGQTYTNNWVIDWSTYNGSTVLGYYRVQNGVNIAWNASIDSAIGTFGTFSGCRLPNANELLNIINYGITSCLNYSPFNLTGFSLWTSTTPLNSTGTAFVVLASQNVYFSVATKSVTTAAGLNCRYIPCRTFTVTGTTLT
jgi:hypothetical protein